MAEIFEFIVIMFVNSFWIFGIRTLFSSGHLLEELDKTLELILPVFIYKPTVGCVMCMASIHGSIGFFIFLYPDISLFLWPVYCVCLCGFNSIIDHALN